MRYVVVGAGAIGGGIGALLHEAGVPTTLVARGPHLTAVRRDGLRLVQGGAERVVDVPVVGSPGEADWTDDTVVVLAVKSHHTAGAVEDLLAVAPATTPIVAAQNGVANEPALLRWFASVHGICVMMPASHLEPGRVVLHSGGLPGLLDVGRFPAGVDAVDEVVAADLRAAGFASVPRPDVMAWKRRKLLLNLGNGVDAAYAEGPAADELTERCRAEGEAALAAAGVAVVSAEQDRERRGELLRPLLDRDAAGSSTWQSLSRGTGGTEVDHLNGEVVLLGRRHGVATPANLVVQHAVRDLARAGGPARSLDAAAALRSLPDAAS